MYPMASTRASENSPGFSSLANSGDLLDQHDGFPNPSDFAISIIRDSLTESSPGCKTKMSDRTGLAPAGRGNVDGCESVATRHGSSRMAVTGRSAIGLEGRSVIRETVGHLRDLPRYRQILTTLVRYGYQDVVAALHLEGLVRPIERVGAG